MTSLPRRGQSQKNDITEAEKTRRCTVSLAAITLTAFLIVFHHTWLDMVQTWYSSRTYSHCFLIVPLFLYLVWVRRKHLIGLAWEPAYKAVATLGLCSALWLVGNLGDVKVAEEFAFVAMLICLVWAFFGTNVARSMRFPLAFLFFAVPFGVGMIRPLQDFTAWFTVHALNLTGIAAVLQNHTLSVPSGAWTVAEACSGIRYLFASLVLGTVFASLIYRSRARQILFVLASAVVPILANGLRAYLVVFLAYVTNNRLAAGVDHVVYGGLFFVAVQTALLGIGLQWREGSVLSLEVSEPPAIALTGPQKTQSIKKLLVCAAAVAAVIVVIPTLANRLWERSNSDAWSMPNITVSAPWRSTLVRDSTWSSTVTGAEGSYIRSYVSENGMVQVRYGLFTGRSVSLVDGYNLFADPRFWSAISHKTTSAMFEGQHLYVDETVFSGPALRTVWTWYWVNGEYTRSPVRVKWLQARDRLLGRPTAGVAITLGSDTPTGDPATARETLAEFVQHTTLSAPMSSHHP